MKVMKMMRVPLILVVTVEVEVIPVTVSLMMSKHPFDIMSFTIIQETQK